MILLWAAIIPAPLIAQWNPAPPLWPGGVIWDDFVYESRDELTRSTEWCVADPLAIPASSRACEKRSEKAWYETNWREAPVGRSDGIRTSGSRNGGWVEFRLYDGEVYQWGLIPTIVSGFIDRTGTWYARVRLQDFSQLAPGLSTSFWTQSTYWTCANVAPGASCSTADEKFWSEWNFEWTTKWGLRQGRRGPWLATGAVVDGEGTAIGGSPLGANPAAQDLSCETPDGRRLAWDACRLYLINGRSDPSPDGPFVDLMVRFNGREVFWEVIAHANRSSLPHPWIRMTSTSSQLGPGQPVMTTFSLAPVMGVAMEGDRWMVADWYLFTPETDKSASDMIRAARWLSERAGYRRINTTGRRLARPAASAGLRLESRQDGLDDSEFLVLPPANYNTFYDIFWSYRVTNRANNEGVPLYERRWHEVDDHSMKVRIPEVGRYRYSEVRVSYRLHRDEHGTHAGPIQIRPTDEICIASSNYGLRYARGCRRQ